MSTPMPSSLVITGVLQHTPFWVWIVLAAITLVGLKQTREHLVTRRRVLLIALGLGVYSLVGATQAFGARPDVVLAWICGATLTVALSQWTRRPGDLRPQDDGRFVLRGSLIPLLTMWTVFAMRYLVTVTLLFQRDWAQLAGFSLGVSLAYGALSGVFLARALRVLGASAPRLALKPA